MSQPKKATDGSSASGFRPKDIVIAVYNVSRKGKRKLLAKNRFDLFHHGGRDVERVTEAEAAFTSLRFKLYPETKKVMKCSVSVALSHGEKNKPADGTVADPKIIEIEDDDAASSISSRRSSINIRLAQNYQPPGTPTSPSLSVASSQIGLLPVTPPPSLPIATASSSVPSTVASHAHPSSILASVHNEDADVVKSPTVQVIKDILKDYTPSPTAEIQPADSLPSNPGVPTAGSVVMSSGCTMTNGSKSPPKKHEDITPSVGGVRVTSDEEDVRNDVPVDSPPSPVTPPPLTPPRRPSFRLDVAVRTPEPFPANGKNRTLKAMTPGTPSSEAERSRKNMQKDELMEWAKFRLDKYNQIKITNLSSSWRSGLAFCSLIHSVYPELIPLSHLKAFNADKVNCPLALSASKMIGVDMSPPLAESVTDIKLKPDVVAVYLERLKVKLEQRKEFSDSELQQWRRGCYERFELWANEFMVQSPVESRPKSVVKSPDPQERPKSIVLEGSPSENRKRVKELIAQAHLSMSSSQEEDTPPQSAAVEAAEHLQSREGSTVTLAGAMTTSVTLDEIATEMAKLEQQREEMDIEMNVLQRFMREDDSDDRERLERWLELVNDKNALDRTQMQLNIKEKEASISRRHNTIMAELQKVRIGFFSLDYKLRVSYKSTFCEDCYLIRYVRKTDTIHFLCLVLRYPKYRKRTRLRWKRSAKKSCLMRW